MSTLSASAEAPDLTRLFAPATVAGLSLRNRVAMAPMSRYFSPGGIPGADVAEYYRRRAAAGVGLILSEGTYIPHASAHSYENVPVFGGDPALAGWKAVIEAVHSAGGLMFPQLWHTGSFRTSGMAPDPSLPGLGPSANTNAFTGAEEPTRPMTEAEIADVIAAYAQAAGDAQRLGFDGVEVHGAHGYLIDEFLWSVTNRRTDGWNGDRRERTRFACEVIRAIRDAVGPDFPISFRFSQWKQQDYKAKLGDTPQELGEVLEPLAEAGVTLLHCSTRRIWEPAFPEESDMTMAGWAKKLTGLPTIAVGGVGLDRPGLNTAGAASLDVVASPLERGEFDILAVGRALLADAHWVEKAEAGRLDQMIGYDKAMLDRLD
ncbi:NADH:flavin oxidoreductase [Oceanibium sediminis]|uniref:NADH:flavin oxidoreductase n=1 Tax=Oceanibium sediminis TaxID=2026339 RepID=UPI000DD2B6A8|nr:NADH:flavin oxidoreductase [Oceanibium sediminis]